MNHKQSEYKNDRILVVDDDPDYLGALCEKLELAGYNVSMAPSGEKALEIIHNDPPSLILLDIVMPKMDGFEVCRRLKSDPSTADIPIIFVTGKTESVIEGFRLGAVDYINKTFVESEKTIAEEELLVRVETHLKIQRLKRELIQKNHNLEEEIEKRKRSDEAREIAENDKRRFDSQLSVISEQEAKRWGIDAFIGQSKTFREILKQINSLQAIEKARVLIVGESGTGKELVARAIHYGGARSKSPFIPVNCANISKELAESEFFGHEKGAFTGAIKYQPGAFERADGGTLFLDEIGEMPSGLQSKFLRVLEDGYFTPLGGKVKHADVRIITATNVDLEKEIENGRFRKDLYHRLYEFRIVVPPLRDRKDDIPLLAEHFVDRYSDEYGIKRPTLTQEAISTLENYHFPGNVRELRNTIARAMINMHIEGDSEILSKHLGLPLAKGTDESRAKYIMEKFINELISDAEDYSNYEDLFQSCLIEQVLKKYKGNRHEVSKRLNKDRSYLLKLIKRWNIQEPDR